MSGSYIPLLVFGFESVGEMHPYRSGAIAQKTASSPSRAAQSSLFGGDSPPSAHWTARSNLGDRADLARRGILDTVPPSSPPQQVHGNP